MSSGTIIGAAIGALVVGIAIGFFIPTDDGVQEISQITLQQEQVGYDIEKLTIGFIPSEKADVLTPKAESLARFLESEFDGQVEIDVVVPSNYETIIEGLKFGHVHAAFMDTGPGWIAHDRANAEVVMAEVKKGKVGYYATVWQRADSDYSSIDEAICWTLNGVRYPSLIPSIRE